MTYPSSPEERDGVFGVNPSGGNPERDGEEREGVGERDRSVRV